MKRVMIWILALFLALALIIPVLAQVSPNFDLGWHALSGGGGSRQSTHYQIDDVLGQWPDGLSSSANYQIDPGFWHVGRVIEPRRLYLPVVLES